MDSNYLENFMIPNIEITLESIFRNSNKKQRKVSDNEAKKSIYYKMSDRELATRMVDRLNQNMFIQLAPKSDPNVAKPLAVMKMLSKYYEYNIDGIPVAVSNMKEQEPSFTVYAYIPKTNTSCARAISTKKIELIKELIREDENR